MQEGGIVAVGRNAKGINRLPFVMFTYKTSTQKEIIAKKYKELIQKFIYLFIHKKPSWIVL